MKFHESARKHYERDRLTDDIVLYAVQHALLCEPLDDEDDPRRWLLLGVILRDGCSSSSSSPSTPETS